MLFPEEKIKLNLTQADIIYYPQFLSLEQTAMYYNELLHTISWKEETIKIYGKTHLQPRLTAFYSINQDNYTYSNITLKGLPFTNILNVLQQKLKNKIDINFNSCLANLYRNGQDSNGWHADDEKALGINPCIASISLGAPRIF